VNLSDWLGTLARNEGVVEAGGVAPGWLTLLGEGDAFREAAYGAAERAEPAPPPKPDPVIADPLAEATARAFADGERVGRAAAEVEAEARAARQRALRLNFRALDEAAMAVLAEDLSATVMALCDGVLGEAAKDRAGLLARVDAAVRRIGGAADTLALHLNPDDIALLGADALAGWRVIPDAALAPGSVLIAGADGSVSDGPAEWRRAIAAAVHG
jgi:flagellar assembly protein FliH